MPTVEGLVELIVMRLILEPVSVECARVRADTEFV